MTTNFTYPPTRRQELAEELHSQVVMDPYRWLEETESDEVSAWIEAQNELAFEYLGQVPQREAIRQRLETLWSYDKFGVPFKRGGRYFYTRQSGLQNQGVLYWTEGIDGEERELLDPNTLSDDGTVALMGYAVSDDGQHLAYGLSASGSDWMEWRVRHVETGEDLPDHLRWVKFSGASWTKDGQGFFYSRYDAPSQSGETYKEANYNQKLYYHQIGTDQASDEVVYARPDHKEWGFGGGVTKDGRYLIIHVWQGTNRENNLFYQDLEAGGAVVELLTDFQADFTLVGNDGPLFYIYTDLDAPNARLIAIDTQNPARENWREIIPEAPEALEGVSYVGGRFVAIYLQDAKNLVKVFESDGSFVTTVDLPGMGTVMGFGGRPQEPETFFHFTSFTDPGSLYRYNVQSGEVSLFRRPDLPFDPADYVTEQIFYPSKDGTQVPMFLIRRRDVTPGPDVPVYQYGYGGFNISLTPMFRTSWLVWMEMGGVVAQPNLRGGGEYGKAWHDGGRVLQKQNVFDDFMAASEWLVAEGKASREKLAIEGRSNGGLLVGACLTQRPDLFGAAVAGVGVLDMLRFHKFTIGWAWTSDYGSPDNPEEFRALLAYSPYHNARPGSYPPTLIITGDHDDRVFPGHSFKFAAALQHAQQGDAPVLIRIDTKAGHGAGKPTAKAIEEIADVWAFLVRALDHQPTLER
jgi:prolyl oligopeptidase